MSDINYISIVPDPHRLFASFDQFRYKFTSTYEIRIYMNSARPPSQQSNMHGNK